MTEIAREERAKIMENLIQIRSDIKKYEAMLKPKVVKPPKIKTDDTVELVLSESEDSSGIM